MDRILERTGRQPAIRRSCNYWMGWETQMDVSENSGTFKIIHFNRVFQYKPIHFGVFPYFWKHPNPKLFVRSQSSMEVCSRSKPNKLMKNPSFGGSNQSVLGSLRHIFQYSYLAGGFKYFFMFIPTWGDDPIWLIFFRMGRMGWNHQLVTVGPQQRTSPSVECNWHLIGFFHQKMIVEENNYTPEHYNGTHQRRLGSDDIFRISSVGDF